MIQLWIFLLALLVLIAKDKVSNNGVLDPILDRYWLLLVTQEIATWIP